MLQIKDKNITFLDVTEEEIKGQLTNVVHATLSPEMRSCPECGCTKMGVNGNHQFVKNGKKVTTIRLAAFNLNRSFLTEDAITYLIQLFKIVKCFQSWINCIFT